jgi:DNA (cytosine-5)-methyltransferase 1
MLTFGSLFSGIGGFDLGFERAGMRPAWQVEINERCNQVLARHWPNVQRYGDVRDVGRDGLESVDVICGGFPCQDLSVAGRRDGLAGERSGLWFEFLRVIEELKPEWVVIENVPGLLSSNGGRDLAIILSGLENCGYWWAYRTLDAQFFGVPQRRRRVFIVGCLTRGRAQQVLFERESSPWDIAPGRDAGASITQALTGRLGGGGADDNKAQAGFYIAPTLSAHPPRYIGNEEALCFEPRYARNGRGVPSSVAAPLKYTDNTGDAVQRVAGLFGVRRLTPLECERLQGFPDDWTNVNGMSDSARYRMLGNAVAVSVAEWIGRRLARTEDRVAARDK